MRTNIEIDDQLMSEAIRLSGAATKKAAVEMGLKALVQIKQQERIRRFRGKLPWSGNLDELRRDG